MAVDDAPSEDKRAPRDSDLRLADLTEHVREVFWLYDAVRERNLYISSAWMDMWQRPLSDVHEWAKWIHEADRDGVVAATRLSSMDESFDLTYRIRRPDGSVRWIRDRGFPIADEAGRVYRLAGIAEDVTSRKREEDGMLRARDELEQRVRERTTDLVRVNDKLRQEIEERRAAERKIRELEVEMNHAARLSTVGEMTASIAHELNQPLAAIVQYGGACLELMRASASGHDELRELVEDIVGQGLRAGEIIQRLRAFTRKREPHRSPVDVGQVLAEIVPLLRLDARNHEAAIEIAIEESTPRVLADRIQIQQAVVNLVRNAIEAPVRPPSGEHTIRIEVARRCGAYVEISVADNGPGFPPGVLANAFEPFYSTKERGMGLGLAISRSIAAAHGGRLAARNRRAGGAVVTLELPLLRASGASDSSEFVVNE